MSSPQLRGLLGASFQLVITIGILVVYALGKKGDQRPRLPKSRKNWNGYTCMHDRFDSNSYSILAETWLNLSRFSTLVTEHWAPSLTHWRLELFSESQLQEFQPRLAAMATCQTAHSRYVALSALHALLYTVKRLIVRWHAALFMPLHSCGQGSRRGHCEAGYFHANLAFSFLDNTQRSITIYTRARVSLLSSCSLEHRPSIIAEKPAVEIQFLRQL